MAIHQLTLDGANLHGHFSPDLPPIARIASGDTIESALLDAGWGIEPPGSGGTPRARHPKFQDPDHRGHCLVGPIWVDGARPGRTLVVHIDEIVTDSYGLTFAGGFYHRVYQALDLVNAPETVLLWSLDSDTGLATDNRGRRVRLRPFLGVMGVAPREPGKHPTPPPRIWGGNIDCRDLVAGTRLYLPIGVEGALFSFGDGHAAQGQGEVSVTAIECPMARVRLRLEVADEPVIPSPRAWTPSGWLTFGFDEDLERATMKALDAMIALLMSEHRIDSRGEALALATAVVDLHITQIANPTMGVHAFLPHDAFVV